MENNNPKVSIVISAYNYLDYLKWCVESCLAQRYRPIEIVIVDDCSDDGTKEYFNDLYPCAGVEFVTCSHTSNKGIAATKNTGILKSSGDLIALLDCDDLLTPNSITDRVKQFNKHPELDLVHGLAYHMEENNGFRYNYQKALKGSFKIHGKTKTINSQTMMVRRDVFEKYGLFYEPRELHSKEDKEWKYRLGIHPKSPLPKLIRDKKINKMLAYYRIHQMSAKTGRSPEKKKALLKVFDERIRVLKKDGITYENTRMI